MSTQNEVAKPEPKMCPAGCGREYGARSHSGPVLCPWAQAYMDAPTEGDKPAWSAYASSIAISIRLPHLKHGP